MAKITNHSDVDLTLPITGQVVRAGATIRTTRWNLIKGAPVVANWLRAGVLTADKGAEDAVVLAPPTPESIEVEIPANWRGLTWNERRALAARFSVEPVLNGEDADAAIAAELARREG